MLCAVCFNMAIIGVNFDWSSCMRLHSALCKMDVVHAESGLAVTYVVCLQLCRCIGSC